jgi:hypothetical protein
VTSPALVQTTGARQIRTAAGWSTVVQKRQWRGVYPAVVEWSYYGAAHRHDVHGDLATQRACEIRISRLREVGDEHELLSLGQAGDRCAFITYLDLLVDGDRTDELCALAQAGDGRAMATLLEMLVHQEREAELREEVAADRADITWLTGYLSSRGRLSEALSELDTWADRHPHRQGWAHAQRIDLLLAHDQVAPVQATAQAGSRIAARRLRQLAIKRPPN